jgi:hypothetical protein
MGNLWQRRVPSSVGAKRRKYWLMAASALVPLSLGVSEPALAQCSTVGSTTTCTPGGNPYSTGINVDGTATPSLPLSLLLQPPGVLVDIPAGAGGVNAVNAANSTGVTPLSGDITITADGVTINNAANPSSNNNTGLRIQSSGAATINATNTTIDVAGTASDWAILAFAMPNLTGTARDVSVNWSGPSLTSTTSDEGGGIQADNRGIGNAIVVASGNINVFGSGNFTTQYGLLAHAGDSLLAPSGDGSASVTLKSGSTLNVSANRPRGILAWVDGNGSATVTTEANTVINVSGTQFGGRGVYVFSGGTATAPNELRAEVASKITSLGPATTDPSNLPVGIRANNSGTDLPIVVNYTGPGITVEGGNGVGILATSGSGSINVTSSGPIKTTGEFSSGIVAITGGNAINIVSGGSVMGGWQDTGVTPTFNRPPAGVILDSNGGPATLTNNGSIGALSDRAIAGDPQVINNGTITGFVQFTGGGNSIINNGTFDLRHFADTTGAVDASGNGVRDTLRVAIADLGDGPNNSFFNNGTLRLPAVIGATTLDSAGQYLPLGNPNNAMTPGGPLQGHLIGVQTFINSGVIDLQSNPVAGDVLVITGARQAGLAVNPLIAGPGPGIFISNGGKLMLDTVLNQGDVATRSDTLVVDGTSVGGLGPTKMVIKNAGGPGVLTVNNGILVVQVLNPTLSDPRAFSLSGGRVTAARLTTSCFMAASLRDREVTGTCATSL